MSKVTSEIREGVNVIFDCIDYVCDKLQISDEEQQKAFDYIMEEIVMPGVAMSLTEKISEVLKSEEETNHNSKRIMRVPHDNGYKYIMSSHNESGLNKRKNDFTFELIDFCFATKEEAELVLSKLRDYANEFGNVTVGYLYELTDEFCPFIAEHYGWKVLDLENVKIIRQRCGYRLVLPDPVRLEEFK